MTLQDSKGKVKFQGQLTEAFGMERGLRQSAALSATLFNVVLAKVIKNVEMNRNVTIFNRTRQYTAYTDNVLILELSVKAIQEVVTQIEKSALSTGLVIKESKTKHI